MVNLVEAERVAWAAPGGEGAGAQPDRAHAAAAVGPVGAQEPADAAGRSVVAARVGLPVRMQVLEAMNRRAMLQREVMEVGVAGVVLVDLEHAVEAARHAQGPLQGGRRDVGEAVAERRQGDERDRPGPASRTLAERAVLVLAEDEEHQRRRQEEREVQFEIVGQDERRDEADEDPAGGAAGGEREVEAGELPRAGTQAVDLAVADHAGDEHRAEVERGERRDVGVGLRLIEVPEDHAQQGGQQRQPDAAVVPARAVEADDEREQVEAQRQHPEEGHDGDILTELVGDGQEQHHAAGGEGEPEQLAGGGGGFFGGFLLRRAGVGRGGLPDFQATPGRESGVDREAPGPAFGLRLAAQLRFEEEGVGQQGEQRADVGEGVETVRGDARVGFAEPCLQERAGGGEDEVGQAKAGQQEQQDVAGRVRPVGWLPLVAGRDG